MADGSGAGPASTAFGFDPDSPKGGGQPPRKEPKPIGSKEWMEKLMVHKGQLLAEDPHQEVMQRLRKGAIAFLMVFVFYLLGGIYLTQGEGWRTVDAIYFSVVVMLFQTLAPPTQTTVGYGDNEEPIESTGAKIFVAIFCLLAVFVISAVLVFTFATWNQFRLRYVTELKHKILDSIGGGDHGEVDIKARAVWDSRVNLGARFSIVLLVWIVGFLVLLFVEEFSGVDSVYLLAVSATTVGLGDVSPQTDAGKIVWIFYLGMLTASTGLLISVLAEILFGIPDIDSLFDDHHVTREVLEAVDADSDGVVTREEWLAAMVVRLGYADQDALQSIYRAFDRLDTNGNNELCIQELFQGFESPPARRDTEAT